MTSLRFDFARDLDMTDARQRRDVGMARADANAPDDFRAAADQAIRLTAERYDTFIVDDVWFYVPEQTRQHVNLKAMGPAMKRAQRNGWIVPTDQYRVGSQPKSHGNPRVVWRSLVKK